MSTNVASLPSWKLALMERKRKQDPSTSVSAGAPDKADTGSGGVELRAGVPAWKRDVLIKKHQQQGNHFGRSSPLESDIRHDALNGGPKAPTNQRSYLHPDGGGEAQEFYPQEGQTPRDYEGYDGQLADERLLPITKNPILLLDLEKKHHRTSRGSTHSPSGGDNFRNSLSPAVQADIFPPDDGRVQRSRGDGENDEVFGGDGEDGEGMTYGKGFVHRLLMRFSGLTSSGGKEKDEGHHYHVGGARSPRQTRSSSEMPPRSGDPVSKQRGQPDGQDRRLMIEVTRSCADLLPSAPPVSALPHSGELKYDGHSEHAQNGVPNGVIVATKCISGGPDIEIKCANKSNMSNIVENGAGSGGEERPPVHTVSNVRNIFERFAPSLSRRSKSSKAAGVPSDAKNPKSIPAPSIVQSSEGGVTELSVNRANVTGDYSSRDTQRSNAIGYTQAKAATYVESGRLYGATPVDYKKDINENDTRSTTNSASRDKKNKTSLSNINSVASVLVEPAVTVSSGGSRNSASTKEERSDISVSAISGHSSGNNKSAYSAVRMEPQGVAVSAERIAPIKSKTLVSVVSNLSVPLVTPSVVPTVTPVSNASHKSTRSDTAKSWSKASTEPNATGMVPRPLEASSQTSSNTSQSVLVKPQAVPATSQTNLVTSQAVLTTPNAIQITSQATLQSITENAQNGIALHSTQPSRTIPSQSDLTQSAPINPESLQGPTKPGLSEGSTKSVFPPQGPSKAGPSRPGMLLIRPASNLVASKTKVEYLELTKYNNVTKGEFAPARRQFASDAAATADDSPDGDGGYGGAVEEQKAVMFVGGAVALERSLLAKTKRANKLQIQFDDDATTIFEYPSEQSLMDATPAQPGDCDYPDASQRSAGEEDDSEAATLRLKAAPGLGNNSSGALASYQSRTQVHYQFGMYSGEGGAGQEGPSAPRPSAAQATQAPAQPEPVISPEQETYSGASSSDLLF